MATRFFSPALKWYGALPAAPLILYLSKRGPTHAPRPGVGLRPWFSSPNVTSSITVGMKSWLSES